MGRLSSCHRVAAFVLPVLAAMGCGSNSSPVEPPRDPDPGIVAGARLRPVMAVAEGGVEAFVHWYDTELDVACRFERDASGAERCLPDGDRVVFIDAECTEAAVLSECGSQAEYGRLDRGHLIDDVCDPDRHASWFRMYRVSSAVDVSEYYETWTVDLKVFCPSEPTQLAAGQVLRSASHVPRETFVAAVPTVEAGDERLGRRVLSATDGSREVLSGFDNHFGDTCFPWAAADQYRCYPFGAARAYGNYADPGCSGLAASDPCEPSSLVVDVTVHMDHQCSVDLYAPGEPVSTLYYKDIPYNDCKPVAATHPHVELGAPLPADALAGTRLQRRGSGRLRTNIHTSESGLPLLFEPYHLFDSELDSPCGPRDLGAAGIRCVPEAGINEDGPRYADPACTEPVALAQEQSFCGQPPFFARYWLVCESPSSLEVRPTEEEVSDDIYAREGSACVAASVGPFEHVLRLGPPIPHDSLAAVDYVVR